MSANRFRLSSVAACLGIAVSCLVACGGSSASSSGSAGGGASADSSGGAAAHAGARANGEAGSADDPDQGGASSGGSSSADAGAGPADAGAGGDGEPPAPECTAANFSQVCPDKACNLVSGCMAGACQYTPVAVCVNRLGIGSFAPGAADVTVGDVTLHGSIGAFRVNDGPVCKSTTCVTGGITP